MAQRNDNNGKGWFQVAQFTTGEWYVAHTAHEFDDKGRPNFTDRETAEETAAYMMLSGY